MSTSSNSLPTLFRRRRSGEPLHAEAEGDVSEHVHVWKQGQVLKHQAEPSLLGRHAVQYIAVEPHFSVIRLL